ncbi:hypothetical protein EYF80_058109 [Liparis tanakae]|uniref:Uncharacterized protein n=1 Tax=Liparis tanakae TaxID=230148 RepID=A0A4Z2ESH5_9TELE|nr:hypothetical protein EYF80_058109 [Liparis tanakae]
MKSRRRAEWKGIALLPRLRAASMTHRRQQAPGCMIVTAKELLEFLGGEGMVKSRQRGCGNERGPSCPISQQVHALSAFLQKHHAALVTSGILVLTNQLTEQEAHRALPCLRSAGGKLLRAEDLSSGGTGEQARNRVGLGPRIHLSQEDIRSVSGPGGCTRPTLSRSVASVLPLDASSQCLLILRVCPTTSLQALYLLLRPAEHADGVDVTGVLGQAPLSFDPLRDGLRDIDRLQGDKERTGM